MKLIVGLLLISIWTIFGHLPLVESAPSQWHAVTIRKIESDTKILPLIGQLINKSVQIGLYDRQAADQLSAFAKLVRPKVDRLKVDGSAVAADRFNKFLALIATKTGQQRQRLLIRALFELMLDNKKITGPNARTLAAQSGVDIVVKIVGNAQGPEVWTKPKITIKSGTSLVRSGTAPKVAVKTLRRGLRYVHRSRITHSKSDMALVVHNLLEDLVSKNLISQRVGSRLLITFNIKGSGQLAAKAGDKAFSYLAVQSLPLRGDCRSKAKLIRGLSMIMRLRLLVAVQNKRLAEILIDFCLDNGAPIDVITKIAYKLGLRIIVRRFTLPKVIVIYRIRYISYVIIIKHNVSKLALIINRLLEILAVKNVIPLETAYMLLAASGVAGTGKFATKPAEPVKPLTVACIRRLVVRVNPFALRKFRAILRYLVKVARTPVDKQLALIRGLLELSLDSRTMTANAAIQLAKSFDVEIRIRFGLARRPKPAIKIIHVSYVFILTQKHANMAKLIYKLAQLAVKHQILDVPGVRHLFVTFKVPGNAQFDTKGVNALTVQIIKKAVICGGNPLARRLFLGFVNDIVKNKPNDREPHVLAKLLLQLLINNKILSTTTAYRLSARFGIKIEIKYGPAPKPTRPIVKIAYVTTVFCTTASPADEKPDKLAPLINKLLMLAADNHLICAPVPQHILKTCNVPGTGEFKEPQGKPLTVEYITKSIKVTGNPAAARKFIQSLVIYVNNKPTTQGSNLLPVVKMLVELLLDNNLIDENDAKALLKPFKIDLKVHQNPTPITVATKVIFLTRITFLSSGKDLTQLLNQLLHLALKKSILPRDSVKDIVATWKIKPMSPLSNVDGGSPIKQNNIASLLVQGNPIQAIRFIQTLKPIVDNPSKVPDLVKALVHLILDNDAEDEEVVKALCGKAGAPINVDKEEGHAVEPDIVPKPSDKTPETDDSSEEDRPAPIVPPTSELTPERPQTSSESDSDSSESQESANAATAIPVPVKPAPTMPEPKGPVVDGKPDSHDSSSSDDGDDKATKKPAVPGVTKGQLVWTAPPDVPKVGGSTEDDGPKVRQGARTTPKPATLNLNRWFKVRIISVKQNANFGKLIRELVLRCIKANLFTDSVGTNIVNFSESKEPTSSVGNLKVEGRDDAGKRFNNNLVFAGKQTGGVKQRVVIVSLLELLLDNRKCNAAEVRDQCAKQGVIINIGTSSDKDAPAPSINPVPVYRRGVIYLHRSTITNSRSDLATIINNLVEMLIAQKLMCPRTGTRLLLTFGLKGIGKLVPSAGYQPYTYLAVQGLPVRGRPGSRAKLIRAISALMRLRLETNARNKRLAEALIDFALDNGAPIDVITKIAYKLGLKIVIRRFHIPKMRINFKPRSLSYIIINRHNAGKLPSMINRLLEILNDKNVVPTQTAHNLLVTVGVSGTGRFEKTPADLVVKPLIKTACVRKLIVKVAPFALYKFRQTLRYMVKVQKTPVEKQLTLIKALLELLIDSKFHTGPQAVDLAKTFDMDITVKFSNPRSPKPAQKPFYISYVTVVDEKHPNMAKLVVQLSKIAVKHQILDVPSVQQLHATFKIPSCPEFDTKNVKPLSPQILRKSVTCGGNPIARRRFFGSVYDILKNQPNGQEPHSLAKLLIQLLVDNMVLPTSVATRLTSRHGIRIVIKFGPAPKPTRPVVSITTVHTAHCTGTPDAVKPNALGPLVVKLLRLSVDHHLLDKPEGNDILKTCGVPGSGDFKPNEGKILNIDNIRGSLTITGCPTAARKFLQSFIIYLKNKPTNPGLVPLVKMLVELLLDNQLVDGNDAKELLKNYKIELKIIKTIAPITTISKPIFLTRIDFASGGEDMTPLIGHLLQICLKKGILPRDSVRHLVASYKVQFLALVERLAGGKLLNPSNVQELLIVQGAPVAAQRFLKEMRVIVQNPNNKSGLAKILIQLILDNDPDDDDVVAGLCQTTGATVTVDRDEGHLVDPTVCPKPTDKVPEPNDSSSSEEKKPVPTNPPEKELVTKRPRTSSEGDDSSSSSESTEEVEPKGTTAHPVPTKPRPTLPVPKDPVDSKSTGSSSTEEKSGETTKSVKPTKLPIIPTDKPKPVWTTPADVGDVSSDADGGKSSPDSIEIKHGTQTKAPVKPATLNGWAIVRITGQKPNANCGKLIKDLVDRCVKSGVFPENVGSDIVDFSEGKKPSVDNVKCTGREDAGKRFIEHLEVAAKETGQPRQRCVIKALSELLLDNRKIAGPEAKDTSGKCGIIIDISTVPAGPIPKPESSKAVPIYRRGIRIFHRSKITKCNSDLDKVINNLMEMLVSQKLMYQCVGARLMLTFGVKGAGNLQPKSGDEPYSYVAIQGLPTRGNADARGKFIRAISALLRIRIAPNEQKLRFAQFLIDFALDNGAPVNVISKTAYAFGLKIVIQRFPVPKVQPVFKPHYLAYVTVNKHPNELNGLANLICHTLDMLNQKHVLSKNTGYTLLATGGVSRVGAYAPKPPDSVKAIRVPHIKNLVIRVNPLAERKFFDTLRYMIKVAKTPLEKHVTLIKGLMELLIDSKSSTPKEVIAHCGRYAVEITVRYGRPRPRPAIKEIFISYVIMPTETHPNTPKLIYQLADIAVKYQMTDVPSIRNLFATFKVPGNAQFDTNGVKPLTPQILRKNVICGGNPLARARFLGSILNVIKNKPDDQRSSTLAKFLIQLLIDNKAVPTTAALRLCARHGIKIEVRFGSAPKPKRPIVQYIPVTLAVCTPQAQDVDTKSDHLGPLVNKLLKLVVDNHLIEKPDAHDILKTCDVPGTGDFKQGDGKPLKADDVINGAVACTGNAVAAKKFIRALIIYINNQQTNKGPCLLPVVKMLIELLLDNELLEENDAKDVLRAYRIILKINKTPAPVTTVGKVPFLTKVEITPNGKDYNPLLSQLLYIALRKGILPKESVSKIVATFKIQVSNQLSNVGGGKPISSADVNAIVIQGCAISAQRFIKELRPICAQPEKKVELIKALIQLVLDNNAVDDDVISQVCANSGNPVTVDRDEGHVVEPSICPKPDSKKPGPDGESSEEFEAPSATLPPAVPAGGDSGDSDISDSESSSESSEEPKPATLIPVSTRAPATLPHPTYDERPERPESASDSSSSEERTRKPIAGVTTSKVVWTTPDVDVSDNSKEDRSSAIDGHTRPAAETTISIRSGGRQTTKPTTLSRWYTVRIVVVKPECNLDKLIQQLVDRCLQGKLFSQNDVIKVVQYSRDTPGGAAITVEVNGLPDTDTRFNVHLSTIAKESGQNRKQCVIIALYQLLLDNKEISSGDALALGLKHGVQIEIKGIPAGKIEAVPTPAPVKVIPYVPRGVIFVHRCKIVSSSSDLNSVINRIMEMLIAQKLMYERVASNLMLTFGVKGVGKLAPSGGDKPYSYIQIQTLPLRGRQCAKAKFIRAISSLLRIRLTPAAKVSRLAEHLLEFALDNGAPIGVITKIAHQLGLRVIVRRSHVPKVKPNYKPQKVCYVTVKKPNPSKLPILINTLLETLLGKNVITLESAHALLVTVDVPGVGVFEKQPATPVKPLRTCHIKRLIVRVHPFALRKFQDTLRYLIKVAQKPLDKQITLVKGLSELLVDSKAMKGPEVIQICKGFDFEITIRFGIARRPKPVVRPIHISYINIVDPKHSNLPKLILHLSEIAVSHQILDVPSIRHLLVTFKVTGNAKFDTNGLKALTPQTCRKTVTCGGNPVARRRFMDTVLYIIKNKPNDQYPGTLAKLLLQLLVDNKVVPCTGAHRLGARYGIKIEITFGPAPKPTRPIINVIPVTIAVCTFTHPDAEKSQNLGPLIIKLLKLIVDNHLIQITDASDILKTCGVPGTSEFKQQGGKVLSPDDVRVCKVTGNPVAAKKFIKSFIIYLNNKPSNGDNLLPMVKILLEFLLDNELLDENEAKDILQPYKIVIKISKTPAPVTSSSKVPILTKVECTSNGKDQNPLISQLLYICLKKGILPRETIRKIVATFKIVVTNPLSKCDGGKPITSTSFDTLVVQGDHIPAIRFIRELRLNFEKPDKSVLVRILIQLILDNEAEDDDVVVKVCENGGTPIKIDRDEGHVVCPEIVPKPKPGQEDDDSSEEERPEPTQPPKGDLKPDRPRESSESGDSSSSSESREDGAKVTTLNPVPTRPKPTLKEPVDSDSGSDSSSSEDKEKTGKPGIDVTKAVPVWTLPTLPPTDGDKPAPSRPAESPESSAVPDESSSGEDDTPAPTAPPKPIETPAPAVATAVPPASVPDSAETRRPGPKPSDAPKPEPTPAPQTRPPATAAPEPPKKTNASVPDKGDEVIKSTVEVTGEADQTGPFIVQIITDLVSRKIIDEPTAIRILVTFGIDGKPKYDTGDAEPISPNDRIDLEGSPEAERIFVEQLVKFLKGKPRPSKSDCGFLIQLLIQLAVDNTVYDEVAIKKLALKFGFKLNVQVVTVVVPPKEVPDKPLKDGAKDMSEVRLTGEGNPVALINRLIKLLVDGSVLDTPTATQIVFTFNVPGIGPFSQTAGVTALTASEISSIKIRGDPDARKRFIDRVTSALSSKDKTKLAQFLMELALDCYLIKGADAADELVTNFGFDSVQIIITTIIIGSNGAISPSSFASSSVDSKITLHAESPAPDAEDLKDFINHLLQLLVKEKKLDTKAAVDILATFGVEGTDSLAGSGSALSASAFGNLKIDADARPVKKFIGLISSAVESKDLSVVMRALFQLTIDIGLVKIEEVGELAGRFYMPLEFELATNQVKQVQEVQHVEVEVDGEDLDLLDAETKDGLVKLGVKV